MKKLKRGNNFLLALLINMVFNFEWTIPAWILLLCHYLFNLSILWFWVALGVWLANIILWMSIMGWAAKCGNTPDEPKENKNPYSVGTKSKAEE